MPTIGNAEWRLGINDAVDAAIRLGGAKVNEVEEQVRRAAEQAIRTMNEARTHEQGNPALLADSDRAEFDRLMAERKRGEAL